VRIRARIDKLSLAFRYKELIDQGYVKNKAELSCLLGVTVMWVSNEVVVTTVGEQLSTLSGIGSKDLATPEHKNNIQCPGFCTTRYEMITIAACISSVAE